MPGMSGHEAQPHLVKTSPNSSIIILTQSDQEADVLRAIAEGALGLFNQPPCSKLRMASER